MGFGISPLVMTYRSVFLWMKVFLAGSLVEGGFRDMANSKLSSFCMSLLLSIAGLLPVVCVDLFSSFVHVP